MNEQKSIVISTHQVRDLENMIDHITILDNGLLLLDADTHTISSRLRFIKGGNESECRCSIKYRLSRDIVLYCPMKPMKSR